MERLIKVGQIDLSKNRNTRASRLGIGFEKLDRGVFDPEKAYDHVADLGLTWVRLQSGWMRTEKEKGVYDFAWLDDIVDNLLRRNLKPWMCLCYGNPIYSEYAAPFFGAAGCPPIETEEEREGWRNYVMALVKHFHGRVEYYEVWNEPDMKSHWKHSYDEGVYKENPVEYGIFCRDTANAVHEADPEAKVIGLCIAHGYNLTYLSTAFQQGLGDCIDALTFHVYAVDDTLRPGFVKTLRALVDEYNPNIEIIQGEAGTQSRSDGSGALRRCAWTPERQTKYLLRGTIHDIASEVTFSSYFTTVDMIEALHGLVGDVQSYLDYGYFGVLGADFDENGISCGTYTCKPSFTALQVLCNIFREDYRTCELPMRRLVKPSRRVLGTDCEDRTVVTYGFRRSNGAAALTYWNATPILSTHYEGTISFEAVCMDMTNIHLVNLATGEIFRLSEDMIVDKGAGCVELINIPLLDSPLMLTFGDFLLD